MQIPDFEKPIVEIEEKIQTLRGLSSEDVPGLARDIERLEKRRIKKLRSIYKDLTPWERTQVARHPRRPTFCKFKEALLEDFTELCGDRKFGEDQAIVGGLCRFRGRSVLVLGQEKGCDIDSRVQHNFGMARPEGYRKACRLMRLAERFSLPILVFIDTAGAYPGIEAEERGQAEAIATCMQVCLQVRTPIISAIIGEGGSGGAIALATADHVCMLENAIYSVISPEGCASILWRSASYAAQAAQALRMTAGDLLRLHVIDALVPEPLGGAHREPQKTVQALGDQMEKVLSDLEKQDPELLLRKRQDRFLSRRTSSAPAVAN